MLGLLFVFLAPLLRFYTTPRVEKAPLDLYDDIVSTGVGQYFSTNPHFLRLVGSVPLENRQIFRGDVAAGSSSTAVYDSFSSTRDLQHDAVIDASKARIVFDRVTGLAVHCCGESPRESALTLKFPFDVQRTTYHLWDGTAKQALPARYLRDGHIVGLGVYLFLIQAGPLVVNHIAHRLKGQLSQLHLEKNTIPLFGPVLGVILIVAGALLLRAPRKRRAAIQAPPVKEREETPAS